MDPAWVRRGSSCVLGKGLGFLRAWSLVESLHMKERGEEEIRERRGRQEAEAGR